MEVINILREASKKIYENVKDIAGTDDAGGDFGRGAGGDISRNIDIIAEKTVLDYLRGINFECIVLGEECGRVEISKNPKGYIIMDAIDGSANSVRGVPFRITSYNVCYTKLLRRISFSAYHIHDNGESSKDPPR